ncbi:MAG TPA: class I SAM-dependent methyltransferase, partial [Chloroflexota bacterium]|nr:class I SAM-dependent methyltransferase [Chloroflexota bacterium]
MQPTAQAGYEWKSAEKVAEFLDREETDPERKAEHESAHDHMLSLLPFDANAAIQFLDVGAGAGAVSISLMRRFGYATGVLADMSEAMMEAGTETLVPFDGRYRYVEYDMNSPEWPADLKGPFDLAVSARAIHHLTDDQKLVVFRHIHNSL